jgi:hypothetical protein
MAKARRDRCVGMGGVIFSNDCQLQLTTTAKVYVSEMPFAS